LPWAPHALLDHAIAEVGVDQAALGLLNRFEEAAIRNAFLASEAHKPIGLEDPHVLSSRT
jgi:hypothetical protein